MTIISINGLKVIKIDDKGNTIFLKGVEKIAERVWNKIKHLYSQNDEKV